MEFVIRFVGIILLIQMNGSYQVVIPKWDTNDRFCTTATQNDIPEHVAFLRINKGHVDEQASNWKPVADCDASQNCSLYAIPVGSKLSIDPGPVKENAVSSGAKYCFIPHILLEGIEPNASLAANMAPLEAAELTIDHGVLNGDQKKNRMVITTVTQHPVSATPPPITVTAARTGQPDLILKVDARSVISVVNLPPDQAGADFDAPTPGPSHKNHYALYQKLFEFKNGLKPKCGKPQDPRPCPGEIGQPHLNAAAGLRIVCSPGLYP